MKGVRFYREVQDKGKKDEARLKAVVAVFPDTGRIVTAGSRVAYVYDGVAAVFAGDNKPCASTSVDQTYLQKMTVKIGEEEAREIHPKLFEYLEEVSESELHKATSLQLTENVRRSK